MNPKFSKVESAKIGVANVYPILQGTATGLAFLSVVAFVAPIVIVSYLFSKKDHKNAKPVSDYDWDKPIGRHTSNLQAEVRAKHERLR